MSSQKIGIKVANRTFYPIMDEDSPGKKRLVLTTVREGQENVQIDLYRGEGESLEGAQYIGSLVIEHIQTAPGGEPEINLELDLDDTGNIRATATDRATGDHQSLSVGLESVEQDELAMPDFQLDDFDLDEESLPDIDEEPLDLEAPADEEAPDEAPTPQTDAPDEVEAPDEAPAPQTEAPDEVEAPDEAPDDAALEASEDELDLSDLELELDEPDAVELTAEDSGDDVPSADDLVVGASEEEAVDSVPETLPAEPELEAESDLEDLEPEPLPAETDFSDEDLDFELDEDFELDMGTGDEEEEIGEAEEVPVAEEVSEAEEVPEVEEVPVAEQPTETSEPSVEDLEVELGEADELAPDETDELEVEDFDLELDDLDLSEGEADETEADELAPDDADELEVEDFDLDEVSAPDEVEAAASATTQESFDQGETEPDDLSLDDFDFGDLEDDEYGSEAVKTDEIAAQAADVELPEDFPLEEDMEGQPEEEGWPADEPEVEPSDHGYPIVDEAEEELPARRGNNFVMVGFVILALAALAVLIYFIYELLRGESAPPLEASLRVASLLPLLPLRFRLFRRTAGGWRTKP